MEDTDTSLDRVLYAAHRLAMWVLPLAVAVLAGALFAQGELGSHLTEIRYIADNYVRRWREPPGSWGRALSPPGQSPVVRHAAGRAFKGANLYCTGEGTGATLADMDGRVLHRWDISLARVRESVGEVPGPANPDLENYPLIWRAARLLEEGGLLCVFEQPACTPYASALIRLDSQSRLVWAAAGRRFHHDIEVGPDGRIYALAQAVRRGVPGGRWDYYARAPVLWEGIAVLDPGTGKVTGEIGIVDAFLDTPYAGWLLRMPLTPRGDITHANAVRVVSEAAARRHTFLRPGQIVTSLRECDLVAVIDPGTRKVVWAMGGPWKGQHDPEFLPDGGLLVYDNWGAVGKSGWSRAIEVDPVSHAVLWEYCGGPGAPFHSRVYGACQRLPNGNTLVVDAMSGRAIEVSRRGEIVWEMRLQRRSGPWVPALCDLVRVPEEKLKFLGKDKTE